ncbi:MAG: PDDEXK nuclease domain-containing protein [Prevotellaceae bacterium]|nr:PDDEXK nuclease domain-containing protein [Prevotellaceae bacterium]
MVIGTKIQLCLQNQKLSILLQIAYWSLMSCSGYSEQQQLVTTNNGSGFSIFQAVPGKLSWSHLVEIINIENELERNFYIAEAINNSWGYRELERQKERGLFYQLALSKDNTEILHLASKGNQREKPQDIIKNTYFLDFLDLPNSKPSEKTLEDALIEHLEEFLLELGKGFAFVGRQYRLTIDNNDYYADLVFYHIILKCYVIIDLKSGKVRHEDIGQMNMYLGYFAIDKNNESDNPPIGIILAADKNDIMVEYATYGMDAKLFVSKYQLYLPDIEDLRNLLFNQLGHK